MKRKLAMAFLQMAAFCSKGLGSSEIARLAVAIDDMRFDPSEVVLPSVPPHLFSDDE
ncbi:hypothetical protein OIU34_19700 [Pararhizobium sp. BT-229]|uniref:hypothetical protein n=1 Tax=Pararhizobium sp. BT-229 TaxID=2986923 RepID=UPI0021F709B7|nr:hypothetical protein [Pararhizobium sp. BT-229]MCV9964110.1 hypothetical protein [Pararhizobium sp. BT-229]